MDYKPDGLVFSDDEDYLLNIDYDSEEERLRSSFPKNKKRMNIIPGGPQPPDLSMYPESEQQAVLDAYTAKRKSFTDRSRHQCVKKKNSEAKLSATVSADQIEQLRPMSVVKVHRLVDGDSFKNKNVLKLRISEEANLRGITTRANRSDVMNLTVVGINFYVNATFHEHSGWVVHTAVCREGDDVRQRTAVDILNALILLIKLEGSRFNHYKQKAWERDEILTGRGQELMEEAFRDVNLAEYRISINNCDSFHRSQLAG